MTDIKHIPVDLTDERRANLAKLAAYLRTLPADYPDFEMSSFTSNDTKIAHVACGTAACAVGHGPAAGINPIPNETWSDYSYRVFVGFSPAWDWMFAGGWSERDNTVYGAAARIEYMLENGLPKNQYAQRWQYAPLSYTVPA